MPRDRDAEGSGPDDELRRRRSGNDDMPEDGNSYEAAQPPLYYAADRAR